jgi:hypothetical protein
MDGRFDGAGAGRYMVLDEHIQALCPELRAVIDDAVSAGNTVVETWSGWGQAVRLATSQPILTAMCPEVRSHLTYAPVRDPHYWLGEIHCRDHPDWKIVLSYGKHPGHSAEPDLPRHA